MQITALFTTLLLASGAIAAPAISIVSRAKTTESCMARGGKVNSWKVHDFTYEASHTYTSPKKSVYSSTATFTLENSALSYKAKCKATSQSKDSFDGKTYTCKSESGDSASFTFNHKTRVLAIDQSWSCAAEGGRYEAKGSKALELSCDDSTYKNPNYTEGKSGLYSHHLISCKPLTVKVPVTEMSAVL
ncbi:hypothetical protein G7Z17_g12394 [Cylindrodendrum hubeiense]|uniref:AA1-like domain-containing protein n=1 Tax=Cylindrodendrum hubeiense TaxID=595255 RepID=A0A9P5GYZ9_9HYPO|nr:hypothetical protein G7Z17_g12394 [Cylindrodendrum hubeiense]